ncbi:hypothetical protein L218DRAFT_999717 [Marasmius fiardii PR-910]|nr:hypothetical protein L218DRAFT_999717 [Marasmius fiardii PR-910]
MSILIHTRPTYSESRTKTRRRKNSTDRINPRYNALFPFGRKWIHGSSGRKLAIRRCLKTMNEGKLKLPVPQAECFSKNSNDGYVKLENVDDVCIALGVDTASNNLSSEAFAVENRPTLPKPPPIWSRSRQEVCETFDWFRSYQGGVYFSKDVVKGYLLGGFSSKRDGFFKGGKVIISHGGGKSESLSCVKGQVVLREAADQMVGDKSVRALLNNYERGIPLVLLIDHKYSRFPYSLRKSNVSYAVLGLYFIAHVWAEREISGGNNVVRYKFAFQWLDSADPWWWTSDSSMDVAMATGSSEELVYPGEDNATRFRRTPVKLKQQRLSERRPSRDPQLYFPCLQCGNESPQVFGVGWACLNSMCAAFWTHNGAPLPEELGYNGQLLELLPAPDTFSEEFKDIRPPEPITMPRDGITTIRSFTRGFHCRKCGKLSCRFKWQQWECSNCGYFLPVYGKTRSAKEMRDIQNGLTLKEYLNPESGIKRLKLKQFDDNGAHGEIDTFELPDGSGKIVHVKTSPMRRAPLDDIFIEYQNQANSGEILFRRWPLRSHKLQGELLTHYFSHNCGEPYQYVGGAANTVSWDQAPSAVVKARDFIRTRTYQALGDEVDFNEVLSAAYMEDQKMSFHTDDELGLGPTVAGLSLGSPALMHFRRRARGTPGKHEAILTVVLRHGDVLIMHGDGVQKNYEHTVIPVDFRIAATARFINPHRELNK